MPVEKLHWNGSANRGDSAALIRELATTTESGKSQGVRATAPLDPILPNALSSDGSISKAKGLVARIKKELSWQSERSVDRALT
jgi:hypothetical protein